MVYYNLYDERKRARGTTLGVPYTKEYIKLREMQDALNASVGYGINTYEELKKEIANIKLTYRAYANLEKRIPQAIDPEYLRIVEYDNIDIVLEELKKKEEQKRIRKNIGWGLVYD